jgi:hypothetical protein
MGDVMISGPMGNGRKRSPGMPRSMNDLRERFCNGPGGTTEHAICW